MNNLAYKYISTISFANLYNWSFQYTQKCERLFSNKYKCVNIGSFLTRIKDIVDIEDNQNYKRVSIKLYNGGITLRDNELGINIGTKKQFRIKKGHFLLSKIDARNGAIGVVPESCHNAIITGNFWDFEIDAAKADSQFLSLLMTTNYFAKLFDNASNGTTNRHYLQENLFLKTEIPLPPLEIQKKIVKKYNDKVKLAEEQEQKAIELENDIEEYFLFSLGITPKKNKSQINNKFLDVIQFKNLNRWDTLSINNQIDTIINSSNFKSVKIGEHYNIVNRPWKKQTYKCKTFNYIEIGAIDTLEGILNSKEILTEKAPSRATQIIKENDLIIGTTRPYLKKFAIVDKKYDNNICSSGFTVIENSNLYNIFFLKEFLMSSIGVEQLKNRMTGGLYPAITTEELKLIKIPLPSLKIQNQIMNKITKIKEQIKSLKNSAKQNRVAAQEEFEKELFE